MYTVVPYEEDSPTVPKSSGQQEPSHFLWCDLGRLLSVAGNDNC